MSFVKLDTYLNTCITKNLFPGCVCWIGSQKSTYFHKSYGYAQTIQKNVRITKKTLFDVASITKPLATALAIMMLYEKKQIQVDFKLKRYLKSYDEKPNGSVTVFELLTHTSGMPAWFPLYILPEGNRTQYLAQANTKTKKVIYSCLGYIVLGHLIERIMGCQLHTFCNDYIFIPLQLVNTRFLPQRRTNIAATEKGNAYEMQQASCHGNITNVPWRDYLIKGEVHDGNSYYAYNGVSGNAGLFSTALDLSCLLRSYKAGHIVSRKTFKHMTRDHTGGPEQRGIGWVINPFPEYLSHKTFYHTGFTGTMCLVDPEKDLIIIFLTNAVHPAVRPGILDPVRKNLVKIVSGIISGKDTMKNKRKARSHS
jgi:CubicO group peptidase (beta-lactamase class C family)